MVPYSELFYGGEWKLEKAVITLPQ